VAQNVAITGANRREETIQSGDGSFDRANGGSLGGVRELSRLDRFFSRCVSSCRGMSVGSGRLSFWRAKKEEPDDDEKGQPEHDKGSTAQRGYRSGARARLQALR